MRGPTRYPALTVKRSGPLKRSTPLKRGGPLKRSGPIKSRVRTDPDLKVARTEAFTRADWICEARWEGCTGRAEHAHHKLRRSQGGKHTPLNLLAVCARCHEQIHRNPDQAVALGHLIRPTN